jgi:hypothetical protein
MTEPGLGVKDAWRPVPSSGEDVEMDWELSDVLVQ